MNAKKGTPYERNIEASLRQLYPDTRRTHEIGYILQYDIISDIGKKAIECKRIRGISWNQLIKFYKKLVQVAPKGYECYISFQCNHQPSLIFGVDETGKYYIRTFQDIFNVPFIKHIPTHRVIKDDNSGRMEPIKG